MTRSHSWPGLGLPPGRLLTAPIATEAKIPEIVMMAATSVITERSPYIVRTSFSVPQTTVPLASWAAENGIKNVVTVVSDYAPGSMSRLLSSSASRPRVAK